MAGKKRKTAKELRDASLARTRRAREKAKKNGYRTITITLSDSSISKIEERKKFRNMNRNEVIEEYISTFNPRWLPK